MFNTSPEGILDLIAKGESKSVEFKSRLPAADTIANVIASFANTEGGILLIGINDKGGIAGLTYDEITPTVERIDKIAASLLTQPVEIGTADIHGKIIVYAIVDRVPEHRFPIMSSKGLVFQRKGDQTISIPGSSLRGVLRTAAEKLIFDKKEPHRKIIAFVAMSFKDEEEPALVDYYRAMERAIKNADLQVELKRMDLVDGDYEISQQIMEEIDRTDILIADFTLNARNVYFELGYARGKGCRIIQTARKGTTLEFDIRNWRTLFYRNATELEEGLIPELKVAYEDIVYKIS